VVLVVDDLQVILVLVMRALRTLVVEEQVDLEVALVVLVL